MNHANHIEIINAATQKDFDEVRKLIREFLKWHLQRHTEDIELINEYFDPKDFEKELKTLPGNYAKPDGQLLLALYNKKAAGCVALKKIDDASCEMKRMFVYPEYHGKGIGYVLAKAIIDEAKNIGYKTMRLDTSFRQVEALKLYESLGFKKIKPYYDLSEEQKNWLVFMEMEL
jgi:GNAT superfamily N-acetyltransferase